MLMEGMYLSLVAGFGIGLVGSLHCLGMCGPLALALPVAPQPGWRRTTGILAYNLGRAATYALLGVLFGLAGRQFHLWGLQQALSIGAGLFLLVMVVTRWSAANRIPGLSALHARITATLGRWLKQSTHTGSLFGFGMLNGLLPCGLVYVALVSAVAVGDVARSALLMFAFGLGTLPAMAGLMAVGRWIQPSVRRNINRLVPYSIGVLAMILVLRGLNLGIPFISPKMPAGDTTEMCHKPS